MSRFKSVSKIVLKVFIAGALLTLLLVSALYLIYDLPRQIVTPAFYVICRDPVTGQPYDNSMTMNLYWNSTDSIRGENFSNMGRINEVAVQPDGRYAVPERRILSWWPNAELLSVHVTTYRRDSDGIPLDQAGCGGFFYARRFGDGALATNEFMLEGVAGGTVELPSR